MAFVQLSHDRSDFPIKVEEVVVTPKVSTVRKQELERRDEASN